MKSPLFTPPVVFQTWRCTVTLKARPSGLLAYIGAGFWMKCPASPSQDDTAGRGADAADMAASCAPPAAMAVTRTIPAARSPYLSNLAFGDARSQSNLAGKLFGQVIASGVPIAADHQPGTSR